jgi:hypothetical protein
MFCLGKNSVSHTRVMILMKRCDVPLYDVAVSNSTKDDEDQPAKNISGDADKDAVYAPCLCGAQKCKGYMFK